MNYNHKVNYVGCAIKRKTMLVFGDFGINLWSIMPDKIVLAQAEFVLFKEFVGYSPYGACVAILIKQNSAKEGFVGHVIQQKIR